MDLDFKSKTLPKHTTSCQLSLENELFLCYTHLYALTDEKIAIVEIQKLKKLTNIYTLDTHYINFLTSTLHCNILKTTHQNDNNVMYQEIYSSTSSSIGNE